MFKTHILPMFDCEYGCGHPARYEFDNGLLCCSNIASKCPVVRNKLRNSSLGINYKNDSIKISKQKITKHKKEIKKITINKDTHILSIFLCDYGCGQVARYQLKNGKFCCNKHATQCISFKNKTHKKHKYSKSLIFDNLNNSLCDYGCGNVAKYKFKNGKVCCSSYRSSCSKVVMMHTLRITGVKRTKKVKNFKKQLGKNPDYITNEGEKIYICEYGCGEKATYQFKSGKWCCSNHTSKCSKHRQLLRDKKDTPFIGYWTGKKRPKFSKEWRQNIANSARGPCPSKGRPGKKKTKEFKLIMSVRMSGDQNPAKRPEVRNSISNTVKKIWDDPNSVYYTKDYWDKRYKGESTSPNKPEKFITQILNDLFPEKYEFVGNGKLWINRKNPDWVNKEDKKIIEFFGEWWHGENFRKLKLGDNLTNKEHEEERINHYKNNNYNCLIIWEYELKNMDELYKKIINFQKGE